MTADELKEALELLDLTADEAADWWGLDSRIMHGFLDGGRPIPEWLASFATAELLAGANEPGLSKLDLMSALAEKAADDASRNLTALAKYAAGLRPGDSDWTDDDQVALDVAASLPDIRRPHEVPAQSAGAPAAASLVDTQAGRRLCSFLSALAEAERLAGHADAARSWHPFHLDDADGGLTPATAQELGFIRPLDDRGTGEVGLVLTRAGRDFLRRASELRAPRGQ